MAVHSFKVKQAGGGEMDLSQYKGKPMLIVNTASQCGFTPQYEGLEKMFGDKVAVLGFPCNQFGSQEPGNDEEIKNFCKLKYDVSFPVLAKIDVNGDKADPLYKHLKHEMPGILGTEGIKWNFTVDQNGKVVERFSPTDKPESIKPKIDKLLKEAQSTEASK